MPRPMLGDSQWHQGCTGPHGTAAPQPLLQPQSCIPSSLGGLCPCSNSRSSSLDSSGCVGMTHIHEALHWDVLPPPSPRKLSYVLFARAQTMCRNGARAGPRVTPRCAMPVPRVPESVSLAGQLPVPAGHPHTGVPQALPPAAPAEVAAALPSAGLMRSAAADEPQIFLHHPNKCSTRTCS